MTLKLQKETHAALFSTNEIKFTSLPNKKKKSSIEKNLSRRVSHTHTHTQHTKDDKKPTATLRLQNVRLEHLKSELPAPCTLHELKHEM